MEKSKKRASALVGLVAKTMIDRDTYGWPPSCSLFAYQPIRPVNPKSVSQQKRKHK